MTQIKPIVSFKDFSFKYTTQQDKTLKDISLDIYIYPGEKVLVLGPSGSGKTTLAKCINGLIPNQNTGTITGDCIVNGKSIKNTTVFKRGNDVGTVLQDSDAQFVGLSVGEDIAFYLENKETPNPQMEKSVRRTANIVGLSNFIHHLPFDLSGGQKQRTSIAGILHGQSPILLFDEPLAALNPNMSQNIIELIDKLNHEENKTIVIIEHRFEEVLHKNIDKIILLADGRIVKQGAPDDFLSSNILEKFGIREPLYISSIKKRFENFIHNHKFSSIQTNIKNQDSTKNEHVFKIDGLKFSYDNRHTIIDIDHLIIDRGERISLIGKNGSDKSTFAKLLTGLIQPSSGKIFELGESIKNKTIQQIGKNIAYILQNPNKMIIEDTVEEEVGLALKLRKMPEKIITNKVEEVLRVTDLNSMKKWPVSALSYGQKNVSRLHQHLF